MENGPTAATAATKGSKLVGAVGARQLAQRHKDTETQRHKDTEISWAAGWFQNNDYT